MNEPGDVEVTLLRREMVAAVAIGIAVGGVAGAYIKGSGMFYTNLLVAGGLLLLLAIAGLGAIAAARAHETRGAQVLAVFAGVAVVATGAAYAIAPPYRSATADRLTRGTITLHVDEPSAIDRRVEAECRTGPNDPAVFMVFMQGLKVDGRNVMVLFNLSRDATPIRAEKLTIVTDADYIASAEKGLDEMQVGADGLTGRLRFSAAPVANDGTAAPFDPLTGTFAWVCEPTPSG